MAYGFLENAGAVLGGTITLVLIFLNILRLFYGRWFFHNL